jgi:hypothetical protein
MRLRRCTISDAPKRPPCFRLDDAVSRGCAASAVAVVELSHRGGGGGPSRDHGTNPVDRMERFLSRFPLSLVFLRHLSNRTIIDIKERLRIVGSNNNHTTRLVEVGAGTGYLAYLLETVGKDSVAVTAYDKAPHAWNE